MSNPSLHLKNLFTLGSNGHAYLLFGNLLETKELALELAQIATGHSNKTALNPDLLIIELLEDANKISIDQVRDIKNFLSLEPYLRKNKIVLILEAEKMKTETASAILKILEEPPKNSIVVLISEFPQMILPTILSRVEKVTLPSIKIDNETIDKRIKMYNTLILLIKSDLVDRLNTVEKIDEQILDDWIVFFHDLMYIKSDCKDLIENKFYSKELEGVAKNYTSEKITEILKELMYWSNLVKSGINLNQKLLSENIVLKF